MAEVRYVRNMRPNMFKVKLYARTANQVVFPLGRRGERTDTVAVPGEAFQDHNFLRNLRQGKIEEIDRETFMALGTRNEDWPQGELVERVQHGVPSSFDPLVRIKTGLWIEDKETGEKFRDPVSVEKFPPDLMRPTLEFASITSSEEDAKRALREAGLLDDGGEVTPRPEDPAPALKYDQIDRKKSPRKKALKGIVGGEVIEAMEDGE